MQEVSVSALRQEGRPERPEGVRPWLYQLATRRLADHFRRRGRLPDAVPLPDLPSDDGGGWRWLAACEDRERLQAALSKLDADARELLAQRYAGGWGYRALADHWGVSERAVEHRLCVAKRQLKSRLRPDGEDER